MINNLPLEMVNEPSLDYLNGQPHRTRVTLTNADGAYYPVFFEPDAISKPLPDLLQMALDVVYQKNSSGRAEDERFTQLDELTKKAEEVATTGNQTVMKLIGILYTKGTINDDDLMALN